MRLMTLLMLALNSCASAVGPASRPAGDAAAAVLHEAAQRAAAVQTPAKGLDPQGVRELLAGVELVLGDEKAKTATAVSRAEFAESDARAMRSYAERMRSQSIWLPITIGGATFTVGVAGGLVLGKAMR